MSYGEYEDPYHNPEYEVPLPKAAANQPRPDTEITIESVRRPIPETLFYFDKEFWRTLRIWG